MDFTLIKYTELLQALKEKGYQFITFEQYCLDKGPLSKHKFVVFRHDVDLKAENSLAVAQIEYYLGIQASYYFRIIDHSNKPEVIKAIVAMSHEIGYHYEDMSLCNGDVDKAYDHFQIWLEYFRKYYAVETICMHGAPTSKWDGKDLWKKYNYRDLGIIGEPYMDTDFSDVFYLTDTGRCWDGYKVSVRDKIPGYQDEWTAKGLVWHTTEELIAVIKADQLPKHVMITTHPQRWTNDKAQWVKEFVFQKTKNFIKRILLMMK